MTMRYHGDLCFSDGEYTDKQGNQKKKWEKLGIVMQDDESGRMTVRIPLLDKWCSVFPKQEQQQVTRNNIGQQYQQRNPTYTQPGTQPAPRMNVPPNTQEPPPVDDSAELPF